MLKRQFLNKRFPLIFWILAGISFLIVILRAKLAPFTHDETATFYYYIQSGHYMPYYAHLDTNNHILNSMLSNVCYNLMGSSKFVLRIPNILFFIFLIIGVWRICKHLRSDLAKLLLVIGFMFSYNWLTFFSVSRGYGLSFASCILAVSFLVDHIKTNQLKYVIYFGFWMQLAMAASLIMMPVFCLMLGLLLMHQFANKHFFNWKNIVNLLLNGLLILYWVKFSSYLKTQNGLTHGAGESYWLVTFETLIYMVTGSYSQLLQGILVGATILVVVVGLIDQLRSFPSLKNLFLNLHFYFLALFLLEIISIYLMKKVMHINYPEDRTALFFYLTLILYVVFLVDKLESVWMNYFSVAISLALLVHFVMKLNFRKHELYIYDTFPDRFYKTLLEKQKQYSLPITIGGHRCREFIYGFMNYRSDGALNAMDPPELLHMNCDYLIAKAGEKPFYERYYTELDSEPDWNFRLLERKDKIKNNLVLELKDKTFNGDGEFYELMNDTSNFIFPNKNPIRADFTFKVNKVPVPFRAWLVIQIDSMNGNAFCFKRASLNWIKKDYNNEKEYTYSVVTPTLPKQFKCFKAFLWNINKEKIDITFTSLKLYQLEGKGINYVAPIYY
ncbi:MAG: ArnT family glycosyltransferase [Sphingobacteriaceae bacterium]